jgi:hypothetical protein
MSFKNRRAFGIALVVISLVLMAIQAGLWRHSTHQASSETQKIDIESEHSPTEVPGVAGFTLLIVAGALVSYPGSMAGEHD